MMPWRACAALLLLLIAAGCGATDLDLREAAADLARGACRTTDSCTAVCPDGSTLDGRPVHARCRR